MPTKLSSYIGEKVYLSVPGSPPPLGYLNDQHLYSNTRTVSF